MKYYRLFIDVNYPNRWHLAEIEEIKENWDFDLLDRAVSPMQVHTELQQPGVELDYEVGWSNFPHVSERARQALLTLHNIEEQVAFHPTKIRDTETTQQHYVMVIKQSPLCVDEEKSDYDRSEQKYGAAAMARGFLSIYPAFYKLVIDPSRTNDFDIFRLGGCSTYIIVSERLKAAWEKAGVTGATFTPVTD
jgi:hypothetical protein